MTHLPPLITDLGLILVTAGITTLLFKKIQQPLVLGYILAGFLVGPYSSLVPTVSDAESIKTWSEIGVIFLLFSLGLEFSFKKLVKVGGSASITAMVEIILMIVFGFIGGQLMGWSVMDSIFLGAILSMSSTTIIIRAFDEVGAKTQKFAGLVFGILIVEDLIAILLMVVLSTVAISKEFAGGALTMQIFKLIFFLIAWFLAGIFFVPTLLSRTRKLMSDETLLIVSLGMCLLMVIISVNVGFSAALGAFIMGSIFAETTQAEKIEHLIKSVKDLFAAVFFVSVGMMIDPQVLIDHAVPVLVVTLLTIFGKLFATSAGALLSGQPLKQSVQAGMSLAQIGEFSFIIASLGVSLKVTSDFLYPITVAASAVTTLTTPYMIKQSEPVYNYLEKILPQSWIRFFNRYSSGSQQITATSEWNTLLRSYSTQMVIHSVVIIAMILLSKTYLYPVIAELTDKTLTASILTTLLTLTLMTPPIWALAVRKIHHHSYRHLWLDRRMNRSPLIGIEILRIGLAIGLVGMLLNTYFPTIIALIIAIIIIAVVSFIFSKTLNAFYERIENQFLKNLHEKENQKAHYKAIVPWDAHFAKFTIPQEAPFIGKQLIELQFRETYGVNIAMIERGKKTIVSPNRWEYLYPGDKIMVIGTDEQLEKFQDLFDIQKDMVEEKRPDVILKNMIVNKDCILLNHSINQLSADLKSAVLIVGIERNGERILNPDSSTVIQEEDIVWAIGTKEKLNTFFTRPQK
ncbi:MAG: hypothetical protein RL222_1596 [Bacteroidota bacterium]|jgi:CPA2 family monovalent cation:H+ antiporter-2